MTALPAHRLGSSLRCRDARATLARAEAHMPSLGITRLTDITRMDRLGLPVFASVRPRSRTLRVNAGKGVRPVEARVGALMEAIEYAVAEPQATRWERRRLPLGDLMAALPGAVRALDFAPRLDAAADMAQVVDAVRCEDIRRGTPAWLPAQLVFVPFVPEPGPGVFGWSTTGLASGNSVVEATVHGLFEVLERDAEAMNLPRDASRWIFPETLPEPFRDMAARWARIGVRLGVRSIPNEHGLPCFAAYLHEGVDMTVDVAKGMGLHVDRGIALARAICEAAQSRLSYIHGGRDDIVSFFDRCAERADAAASLRRGQALASRFDATGGLAFDAVPQIDSRGWSVEDVLDELLGRLAARGFGHVFRHRFDAGLDGLEVVKVVVARCEELSHSLDRMGPRMFARVMNRA